LRAWDHLFLAMAHHRRGRADKAREYFAIASRQLRSDGYPWRERAESESLCREAEALLGIDRNEIIVADCPSALEKDPRDVRTHNDLAWLLPTCSNPKLRDPRQAVQHAQKAVELAPKDHGCWSTLAVAQSAVGDWAGAAAAYRQVLALSTLAPD